MQFANFDAEMSEHELEIGELRHKEMERNRRIAMVTGITKSSDDLRKVINTDSKTYIDVLATSAAAIEHYLNIVELLLDGTKRLYAVASEHDWQ